MLPLRWKIYRVLNYIQLVYSGLFALVLFQLLFSYPPRGETVWPILFAAMFLLMALVAATNIYIFSKHYPDRLLTGIPFSLHRISLFVSVITNIGLLVVTVAGIIVESDASDSQDEISIKILLACLVLGCIIQLYIFFLQVSLPRYLRKNQDRYMEDLIDSIGKSE